MPKPSVLTLCSSRSTTSGITGKSPRYDIAATKAGEILAASAEPLKVAEAFEKVAADRGDNLDDWLIRFQGVPELKESAAQLTKIINDGRYTRKSDPKNIEANIARLSKGDRPYRLAIAQLRESGELAVPPLLAVLSDPAKQSEYGAARRALLDLGRVAVNPLVAATFSNDPAQLETVVTVLADLGYDSAVPYLARLSENATTPNVKKVADEAIAKLGGGGKAGDLFYDLAEKQFYGRTSIVPDLRFPQANVWKFDVERGLLRTPVAPAIFNDVMTLSQSELAMSLSTSKDALSLWLSADFKREADLPQGTTDATRPANNPDAHYFGVTAGAQYLNVALTRALNDKNNAAALAIVKALQQIVGDANFKSGGSPLIEAMQYPDRRVRFEAAFTLASALPQSSFAGQELVVPLLAEAISQTGQPSVLVVMPTQDAVNGVVQPFKADGFIAAGATNAAGALAAAANVPAIDVVIISEQLPPVEVESLIGLIARSPKMRAAGKLVIVSSPASPWEARKATDSTISTTTTADAAALKDAVKRARDASGALPLDTELATQYASRAGELIKRLAVSRGQVLDLTPARSTLLGALEDGRPEIVKLAGEGLALTNSDDAQKGLLLRAAADGVADDVKVSLFKSLAVSAKFFGNKLDASQLSTLDNVVSGQGAAELKSAAAEARGALNLPNDQARKLILNAANQMPTAK
ncbi:MAG: hypothetical protein QM754_13470 [Tepidisphaeraceae bacterium]